MAISVSSVCLWISMSIWMVAHTRCSSVFEVKMLHFENLRGLKGNGHCCDVLCTGSCDNKFIFCIDRNSNSDVSSCSFGSYRTGEFQGDNNIFRENMRGVANPIRVSVDGSERQIVLKVKVIDVDLHQDDWLDTLYGDLNVTNFGRSSAVPWISTSLTGTRNKSPTRLTLQYKAYCNKDYYGETCSAYCVQQDTPEAGHYNCDDDTGVKICLPGWLSPETNCTTVADPCTNTTCHNGGQCSGANGTYTCTCTEDYKGKHCDIRQVAVVGELCERAPCESATGYGKSSETPTNKNVIIAVCVVVVFSVVGVIIGFVMLRRRKKRARVPNMPDIRSLADLRREEMALTDDVDIYHDINEVDAMCAETKDNDKNMKADQGNPAVPPRNTADLPEEPRYDSLPSKRSVQHNGATASLATPECPRGATSYMDMHSAMDQRDYQLVSGDNEYLYPVNVPVNQWKARACHQQNIYTNDPEDT